MSFSAKIILSEFEKADGMRAVWLQAIIDRQRVKVPLGFYLREKEFNKVNQRVRPSHANHEDYNIELMMAIAKANTIASKFRQEGKPLNPETFKKEYTDPTEKMDLIKFMEKELELKKPAISENTHKSHTTVLNKLTEFRRTIPFNQINREFVQQFRNKLIKDGNGGSTVEKVVKIFKQYLIEAKKKGIAVRDVEIKIKTFRSNRNSLTEDEVKLMDKYFDDPNCPANHRKVLRCFLFSCYTGLRISDVQVLTWQNINGDMLVYTPVKTRSKNEEVSVPLLDVDKKYLPEYTHDKALVFDTFTDQGMNRILKAIASHLSIKKTITYHTSRHTFGSMMGEGGDAIALQRMLGHSDIKTSMGYVHTNVKQLIEAKKARFAKPEVVAEVVENGA